MWETRVRYLGQEDSPGEGNGNPLQYYCLENPRDGEAWWAAVSGVAQSWTRLKRLSSSSSKIVGGNSLLEIICQIGALRSPPTGGPP